MEVEIERREAPDSHPRLTKTHTVELNTNRFMADLTIEYIPRNFVLGEETLENLQQASPSFDDNPEEFLIALYEKIVDSIYPAYNTRDKPWERTPMILDMHYTYDPAGQMAGQMSLGQVR